MLNEIANTVVLDGESLTLEDLVRVARDPLVKIACSENAKARVKKCRESIDEFIKTYKEQYAAWKTWDKMSLAEKERNRQPDLQLVYGVTTGFGEFKSRIISNEDLIRLQENILLSHAVGVGETLNQDDPHNYFQADVVRATLVLRINTFLQGHSGVRLELVECLVSWVNGGIIPLVPIRGSVGSSGDLCPLSHLFVLLLTKSPRDDVRSYGRYYVVGSENDVRRGPIADVPSKGIDSPPECFGNIKNASELWNEAKLLAPLDDTPEQYPVKHKEGLALTNGATFSAAMLALAVHDGENLAQVADIAAGMTLEAMCGVPRSLDPKVHRARPHRGQIDCATNLRHLVTRSRLIKGTRDVQDIYSLRCAPQVHGASRDTLSYAKMVVTAEINAATDNPLFFPKESRPWDTEEGLFRRPGNGADKDTKESQKEIEADQDEYGSEDCLAYSAGNFHGQPVALAADFLGIAIAELANISERRIQALTDANHNRGLPGNLTPNPGVNSGLMIAQYSAAGLVSENKVLAHPASVDSIPTSANTEDHVSMATIAARKLRTILNNAHAVLAIELLVATQALEWRALGRRMSARPRGEDSELHIARRKQFKEDVSTPESLERGATNAAVEAEQLFGIGTAAAFRLVREVVPKPMLEDRLIERDVFPLRELVASARLVLAVNKALSAKLQRSLLPVPELAAK